MSEPWLTAAQISDRWDGVTTQRVSLLSFHVGIGLGSKHMRAGPGYVDEYSPAAVGLIERELRSRGETRS